MSEWVPSEEDRDREGDEVGVSVGDSESKIRPINYKTKQMCKFHYYYYWHYVQYIYISMYTFSIIFNFLAMSTFICNESECVISLMSFDTSVCTSVSTNSITVLNVSNFPT